MPWFETPGSYCKARAILIDVLHLPKHFARWLSAALRTARAVERSGRTIIKVEPDLRAFQRWCREVGENESLSALARYCTFSIAAQQATS
jgi:hypothetical protein